MRREAAWSRLLATGAVWEDLARAIAINARSLPDPIRDDVVDRSARWHVSSALRTARSQLAAGDIGRARQSVHGAQRLHGLCRKPRMMDRLGQRIARLRASEISASLRAA